MQHASALDRKQGAHWRSWVRPIVTVVVTVVALAALALGLLLYWHEDIIDKIYKHVADVNDGEMPVSVASYPSGPEVVSIIGGSGHGLNCSLPRFSDALFDSGGGSGDRHRLVRQRFRQACVFHDLCYRHGLATYGYSQNDCDRILQDHAYRLCQYVLEPDKSRRPGKSAEQCQREAKKVLFGVSIGGSVAYRAWDGSTFFEFDTNPLRSNHFTVSRVVDHPFKPIDADKYRSDPLQIILSFEIKRSSVSVKCANCFRNASGEGITILEKSKERRIGKEFTKAGIPERPAALMNRDLSMIGSRTVWLPPGRHHAAPQLLLDNARGQHLVWLSRTRIEDTGSCIVKADAGKLLTYTLPQVGGCNLEVESPLAPQEVDMFSSSPQSMVVSSEDADAGDIVTIGLSAQKDTLRNLHICAWSARMRGDEAKCRPLTYQSKKIGAELGAFQNFPTTRAEQQVYFARRIATERKSSVLSDHIYRAQGNRFSPEGQAFILDIESPARGTQVAGKNTVKRMIPFSIDDQYDPMMPLSASKDDLRFLSIALIKEREQAGIYLINLNDEMPQPKEAKLTVDGGELALHESWARRPIVVVETKELEPAKTRLIFSRSSILSSGRSNEDRVRMQFLVLERLATAPDKEQFSYQGAATCDVTYGITTGNRDGSDYSCFRSFVPDRAMRKSPAAMMQGAQLLTGRFNTKSKLSLALVDACFEQEPIILDPATGGGTQAFAARTPTVSRPLSSGRSLPKLQRAVACDPLIKPEQFRSEMDKTVKLKE